MFLKWGAIITPGKDKNRYAFMMRPHCEPHFGILASLIFTGPLETNLRDQRACCSYGACSHPITASSNIFYMGSIFLPTCINRAKDSVL